jgi:hypothetical protein
MPSFLLKDVACDAGIKYGVEVYVNEIVKILRVLACHRVTGLVGIGEGVQKSLKGAF